jgi:hypothetical protein
MFDRDTERTVGNERIGRFFGVGSAGVVLGFYGFFLLLWVVLGLAAFVMSVLCFGYSGTTAQHAVGVMFALLFGPFYWVYYAVSADYCGKTQTGLFGTGGRK